MIFIIFVGLLIIRKKQHRLNSIYILEAAFIRKRQKLFCIFLEVLLSAPSQISAPPRFSAPLKTSDFGKRPGPLNRINTVVVTIVECCVLFSGVKLSIRSFVLFPVHMTT